MVGKTNVVPKSLEPGWAAATVKVPLPMSVVQQLRSFENAKQDREQRRKRKWADEEAAAVTAAEEDDDDDDEYEDDDDEKLAATEEAKWARRRTMVADEEASFVPVEPPGGAARLVFEVWDRDIQLSSLLTPPALFGGGGTSTHSATLSLTLPPRGLALRAVKSFTAQSGF